MQTSPIFEEARAEGRVEGRVEGARALLLRQGRQKFGKAPSRKQQTALDAVSDLDRLASLAERLLNANSWAELLNGG